MYVLCGFDSGFMWVRCGSELGFIGVVFGLYLGFDWGFSCVFNLVLVVLYSFFLWFLFEVDLGLGFIGVLFGFSL